MLAVCRCVFSLPIHLRCCNVTAASFPGDNSAQAKRREAFRQIRHPERGSCFRGLQVAKRGRGKGCKLERQGQHKFQDRDVETMEGKTVHEQKGIEKAAKTGHNNVWRYQ
jgi:hypothetical protein